MLLTDDFIEEMIVDTEELVHPDEVRQKKEKKIQFIKKNFFPYFILLSVKHYAKRPLSQVTYDVDLVLNKDTIVMDQFNITGFVCFHR